MTATIEDTEVASPIERALELYNVRGWGKGYFSVNERGNLVVHPQGPGTAAIDLKELVDEVRERGIGLPLLIRFSEIVQARVRELNEAFLGVIAEAGYRGTYRGVYPIKVNQDRYLVERLVEFGRPYHHGLEAGSKPELLAVMALLEDEEALIVCNGYKDEEYVETALLASKLGRRVILVAEKPSELKLIHRIAEATGVTPRIGIRARLSTPGAGHWQASGGDRSKFGFAARELVEAIESLRSLGRLDCFELLHFHLGSQVPSIRSIKDALREAVRIYVDLVGLGAPLAYLDVGGGLGVDYDGSQSDYPSSLNYTLQEYAADVVYGIKEICDEAEVAHPTIVSESGRATVAHHAALILDVLDVAELRLARIPQAPPEEAELPLKNLFDTYREVRAENLLESYHDAIANRDDCLSLFNLGYLSLTHRGLAENIFWATCDEIWRLAQELPQIPEELWGLEADLADTYFCNFSVFQSVPDSWAIDQLFPVLPIHRLDEEPSRRAVLADITCDSDGRIDRFIEPGAVKRVLELHPFDGEPYFLGIFLVGAYQEILGDLHNLFGDTNIVQVSIDPDEDDYQIDHVVEGDSVTDVLAYVSYTRKDLVAQVRRATETALKAKRMTLEESKHLLRMYERGLAGYTYLESE
ncbi:MAG TPA: biosynthetic arginine decarboxylase [Thermoanaerobaculia bacterium]|nr:biosynthetic arginine decarboxylase [Thermoanaerobaculia bacterium]